MEAHPQRGDEHDTGSPHRAGTAQDIVEMLDRISDGVVVMSFDWRFRYLNRPAARLLDSDPEELLGQPVWSYFRDTGTVEYRRALQACVRHGRPFSLTEYYAPVGRWFESRGLPQDDAVLILFRDVTDQQLADNRLQEYTGRMAEAERIAHFGVWRWDPAIQQVHMSQELSAIHGIEPLPMRPGRVLLDAVHPDDRQRVQEALEHARTTREPFAFTERIVRPDGAIREAHVHGRPITAPDGTLRGLVGVVHDITEREQAERALGLNRRRMRAIIDHSPSAISVKNLDGRYVLANTATGRLLGMAPDDIVGRPCSELFPEIAEEQLARDSRALEQSGPVFDESVLHRSGEPRTYETVTFALPDETGRIAETCTIATDVTERRELESERLVRLEWARRIETALAEGRMIVYAQPIVEIATGRATGAELLVRMETADAPRGILGPDAFLPAAERYGLVQAIDTWMVGRALELARSFAPRVNLSAVTMSDPDARREILDRLRGAPEAAARLVFEITETAEPEHLDHAERFASDLTEFGCGLALDDFGTGFGSFTYLRRLPVRYLKIDRSFVADLLASSSDRRVVQSIVSVAEQFGLQAIAEGVEDAVTLTLLSELGTHYAQGFHLGRPAPAEDEAQAGSRFQS